MVRLHGISVPARGDDRAAMMKKAEKIVGAEISDLVIRRRSIDARRKSDVRIIYTVDVAAANEAALLARGDARITEAETYSYDITHVKSDDRPVIVGFGPAGMFAALVLASAGARPIVLERGCDVDTRREKVEHFWKTGELDTECNVQFGEGGAGTFSDGKLNTGTKNPRIEWVLHQFARFGADASVTYDAKPHVGTDALRCVVKNLRNEIISLGGEVRFGAKMVNIIFENGNVAGVEYEQGGEQKRIACRSLILAVGHSARDTFEYLLSAGVPMEPKAFSIGARIEHRQSDIDRAQYGDFAGEKCLGAADYKLVCHTASGSAYTFCMCPGGYVVAAASEEGGVVTNGMSYSGRGGENANSALLVGVSPEDFPYPGALGGMYWQREIEQRAYKAAGGAYRAPSETVGKFLGKDEKTALTPSYAPETAFCDLDDVLPERVTRTMREALEIFDKKLHGFAAPDAVLTAPETRSSSPVRILRGAERQSAICGLYPCGEGAGYAGGITSSAVDGMLTAEAVIKTMI